MATLIKRIEFYLAAFFFFFPFCLAFAENFFPKEEPVRERFMELDEHSSWTLRQGESAVPLNVAAVSQQVAVSLTGGWIFLGPELDFEPFSLLFLSATEVDRFSPVLAQGTPWVQSWKEAIFFITSSPGRLAVLYPQTGVCLDQEFPLNDLSLFTVSNKGFFYSQGRRTSGQVHWNKLLREEQPLVFFPSDLATALDGTIWSCDSLQARPWRLSGDFWKPLAIPQTAGRMIGISPFPDSSGYFASGEGWVGAFTQEGEKLWLREEDFEKRPLPRDIRLRCTKDKLYLWSAQERRVWVWLWNANGPKGAIVAPTTDTLIHSVKSEMKRLLELGSVPQASMVVAVGEEVAKNKLAQQPFSHSWKKTFQELSEAKKHLRALVVGNGQFTLSWTAPYDSPLATWQWEPDALLPTDAQWSVVSRVFWEGIPSEKQSFKIASHADKAPWPGVEKTVFSSLQLPSYMVVEITPVPRPQKKPTSQKTTKKPSPKEPQLPNNSSLSSWQQILLLIPKQDYDLPVE